ncbi:MAG: hypothetical protein ACOZAQ_10915 [Pseudomonadota bacterium]
MVKHFTLACLLAATALSAAQAEISVRASLSQTAPWVREEVLLTLEVVDDRSILEQKITPWTPPGIIPRPLPGQQERVKTETGVVILHRHRWALMPLYPGALTVQPPTLEIRAQDQGAGQSPRRLILSAPPLNLDIRPLNPLLPADVPVGALHIDTAPLPADIPRGRPFTLQLTIEGQGLSARGIRRWLEEGLRDTGSLRLYPLDVKLIDVPDPAQPLRQRAEARLTLEPRASGLIRLPGMTLPFVDPADGALRMVALPETRLRVLHPLWLALRPWMPWLVALTAIAVGAWFGAPRWHRLRARRTWRRTLAEADTPHALRRAWRQAPVGADIPEAIPKLARLDAACYGNRPLDGKGLDALKAELIAMTRQTRKKSSDAR